MQNTEIEKSNPLEPVARMQKGKPGVQELLCFQSGQAIRSGYYDYHKGQNLLRIEG